MKKLQIPNNVTRAFYGFGAQIKKHSPEMLVAAGIVGTIASAVMACKATLKASEVVSEAKDNLNDIHDAVSDVEAGIIPIEDFTPEQQKQALTTVYVQTGVQIIKLYAPAVALGALSITGIVKSNDILRKRNIALAAAYTAVDRGFKDYRSRVIERFGEGLDKELRYNIKTKEIEEVVANEDGSEQTVKKTVQVADINMPSEYAICFDETCRGYDKNSEYNKKFLLDVQNYMNDRLKTRKVVFLNEVYDALGAQRTKAGQIVGWVYDETNPDCDCVIDFNIFDLHDENKRRFVNGYEKAIWLDFNVDGVVYDLLA